MKKIFFYSLLIVFQLFAQDKFQIDRNIIQSGNYFNSEIHYLPSSDNYTLFYSYKIPYSQLFFEKKDGEYKAGFSVNVEVNDSSGNFIDRGFDEKNISVNNFNITNSSEIYLQGLIQLKLAEGKYKLIAIIEDKISKQERVLPPEFFIISKSEKILAPIILESDTILCNGIESYILSNNSSTIPFNKPNDYLAIPVTDSTIKSLTIDIKRSDSTLISNEVNTQSFKLSPFFVLCDNDVVIKKVNDNSGLKYFLFNEFSTNLTEGPIKLEVTPDNNIDKKKDFELNIIWIGKPISLIDPEQAIKYLKIIEPEKKVSELLHGDYFQSLNLYWQPLDPTPNTKYNELMNEFYKRVDYSNTTFKYIDGNGGANSDRGKTYIKYGPPDRIKRDTNNEDKVVESWYYKNPIRTFVFIDSEGTGKYLLVADK